MVLRIYIGKKVDTITNVKAIKKKKLIVYK